MWRTVSLVVAVASVAHLPAPAAQQRVSESDVWHIRELIAATDNALIGQFTAEASWLGLQIHFLRGPTGQVYVPFTLTLEDVPENVMKSVAIYIRVAKRGERTTSADYLRRSVGPTPEVRLPVFSYDAAAAASAELRFMDNARRQRNPYPFEAVHLSDVERLDDIGVVRRALQVPPGTYDLYIAVRDRSPGAGERPMSGVLKRVLEVPNLNATALTVTPPILASEVRSLRSPLSQNEQAARPYALGTFEVVPPAGVFDRSDELTAVLFVYNAATDARGKPSIVTEYRFYRIVDGGFVRPYAEPLQDAHNSETLPAEFNLKGGHQLVPTKSISLAAFAPGLYQVAVTVTDKLSSATASTSADFEVR